MAWSILNPGTGVNIHALTETTIVSPTVDEVIIYDSSASENRKILVQNILADGILSADAGGRAKMADGFVVAAKLGSDVGKCRAWVNFNGTGTVAIRAALNVSSITDAGVGTYVVNVTSSLASADFVVNTALGDTLNGNLGAAIGNYYYSPSFSASAFRLVTHVGGVSTDIPYVCASVFQ